MYTYLLPFHSVHTTYQVYKVSRYVRLGKSPDDYGFMYKGIQNTGCVEGWW